MYRTGLNGRSMAGGWRGHHANIPSYARIAQGRPANLPRPQILLVTARASLPSPAPCPGAHRLRSSVDRGVCSSALRGANARFAKCFPPAGLSVLVAREAEARKKSRVQCVVLAFGLGGRALTRRVTTRRSPPESSLFPFSFVYGIHPRSAGPRDSVAQWIEASRRAPSRALARDDKRLTRVVSVLPSGSSTMEARKKSRVQCVSY